MNNFKKPTNLMMKNENKKIIIDWSAKAGCTCIIKMLFNDMGILEEALNYNNNLEHDANWKIDWPHTYREDVFYKKYGTVSDLLMLDSSYLKFKFVRNPYSRAISSFIRINNDSKIMPELPRPTSFKEFLKFIINKPIKKYDIHFMHQECNVEKRNKMFNEVVKIENLEQEISRINTKYNLNFKPLYNSHHHIKKHVSKEFVGNIVFEQKNEYPSYDCFYDEETKSLVEKIYGDDIKKYNYNFEEFLKDSFAISK